MGAEAAVTQLRRGAVEHCVLALLEDDERYGYDLVQRAHGRRSGGERGHGLPAAQPAPQGRAGGHRLARLAGRAAPPLLRADPARPARPRRLPARPGPSFSKQRSSRSSRRTATRRDTHDDRNRPPAGRATTSRGCARRPRRLPVDQARELVADIEEHLLRPRSRRRPVRGRRCATSSTARHVPAELVIEAAGRRPVAAAPERRQVVRLARSARSAACSPPRSSASCCRLSVPLWILGLVMMARATVWTEREKRARVPRHSASGFFVSLASSVLAWWRAAPRS